MMKKILSHIFLYVCFLSSSKMHQPNGCCWEYWFEQGLSIWASLNLWDHCSWRGITRCSVARCENVITPAVSGPMPAAATHLAAESHSHILPHTDRMGEKFCNVGGFLISVMLISLWSTASRVMMINDR